MPMSQPWPGLRSLFRLACSAMISFGVILFFDGRPRTERSPQSAMRRSSFTEYWRASIQAEKAFLNVPSVCALQDETGVQWARSSESNRKSQPDGLTT